MLALPAGLAAAPRAIFARAPHTAGPSDALTYSGASHENSTFAKITSFADDDIAVWINGSAVFIEPNFAVVEGGTMTPNEIDVRPFLLPGPSLIAIHAQDTIGGCRWAVVSGSIEVIRAAR